MQPATDNLVSPPRGRWYRQPIVWLGAAIFLASLAGCVWIIVAAARHADPPVHAATAGVLGVPSSARSARTPPEARP
jgi:hypothetical protein